jgi:multiple sugar transport system substrate-binding protein
MALLHSPSARKREGWSRRQVAGYAAALAGVVAAACAGARSGDTTAPARVTQPASLLYWTILGGADGSRMHALTEQYQRETPLVKIDDIQGVPEFLQKFIASVVAGSPPDVITIRQTYIAGFVEKDALLDLLPRELQQVGLRAEDFDPVVWKASEYKGKRYAIPFDIHGYQCFYHEGAVRDGGVDPSRPPVTWQDWLNWASQLTQGERFGAFVNNSGGGLLWQFQGFVRQAAKQSGSAADLFSADGKRAGFNNADGNAALSLMADIWRRAKLPLPQGLGLLDAFEQRKLASMVNGPWNLNRLAQPDNPAAADLRVTFCPQKDPSRPSWWAQSHQIALPKPQRVDDHKRAAAFDFVRWLTEHTFEWSKAGQLPANKKVLNSEEYQKSTLLVHRHLKVWEKNLPSAGFMQLHPRYVEIEDQVPPILARAVRNETSPQAALAEAETLVNTLLSQ